MSPRWASSSTVLRGGETRDGVAISCFPKHGLPTLRASGIGKAGVITQDDTRLRTQAERGNLRNERLESLPERGEFMGFAGVQREDGVVVGARFLDVRQFDTRRPKFMIFLRAFGLTRFAESQQTRRSSALCARQGASSRFP